MSFVEEATLLLNDKSSASIKKIDASLKKLTSTAKKAKNALEGISIDTKGLSKASSDIRKLSSEIEKASGKKISIGVDSSKVATAQNRVSALYTSLNKQPKTIVLGANTSRLSQAASLLDSIHRKASTPVTQVVNVRNNNGVGPNQPNVQSMPRVQLDVKPLRGLLYEFMHDFRNNVLMYAYSATKKGTVTEDVARTNLLLRGYDDTTNEEVLRAADRVAEKNTKINSAQALNILNDILPMTADDKGKPNIENAQVIAEQLSRFINLQMMRGVDYENAFEDVFKIARSFDVAGYLQDEKGEISPKNVNHWMANFLKASIVGGREVTPTLLRDTMKLLRVSKYGLNDEGFFTAMALAEMMGSTAGVGTNQMIKQLSGKGVTKETLAFQEAIGLIKTKEVTVGKLGGKKSTTKVVDWEATEKEREKLRQDPLGYVSNVVLPKLLKSGELDRLSSDDEIRAYTEKVLPPVAAIDKAGQLTSDRTATDTLASLLIIANNLQRDIQQMKDLDVSPERMKKIEDQSIVANLHGVNNQIQGLIGDFADSLEVVLIPALGHVNDFLKGTSDLMKDSENPTKADPIKSGAILGGVTSLSLALTSWAANAGKNFIGSLLGGKRVATAASVAARGATVSGLAVPGLLSSGAVLLGGLLRDAMETDLKSRGENSLTHILVDALAEFVALGKQAFNEKPNQSTNSFAGGYGLKYSREERSNLGITKYDMPPDRPIQESSGRDALALTTKFEQVFLDTQNSFTSAGNQVSEAISQSGHDAGNAILNTASQFGNAAGAAIASAIQAAVSNIKVNASVNSVDQKPTVDTGKLKGPN